MAMPMPMPTPMPDNNATMMYMHDMHMQMSFYWGKDVVLLFSKWPGSHSVGMYVVALAAVFLMAVAAEILSGFSKVKLKSLSPVTRALILATVYAVRMGLAYLVMLSVMSYNVGVFAVAVAGHAVGSFVVKYTALVAGDRTPGSNA